jgi:hypothetical protein
MKNNGVIVCIPVFNDWESALLVIEGLDAVAPRLGGPVSVLLVDDGSTQAAPARFPKPLAHIQAIDIVSLRRNLGHQRAIALGLTYIHEHLPCELVIVMDGDGEDAPADVPALVERRRESGRDKVVFAQRAKRSEGLVFRVCYLCYQVLHRILTGRKVEVGNFSVLPYSLIGRLVGVSELWNHYSAAVYKARLPTDMIPIPRAKRLAGEPKMNFVGLVSHGLSAIAVHGDVVGVRVLCAISVVCALAVAGLASVVGVRLFTELGIPGWATTLVSGMTIMLLNLFILAVAFVMFVLRSRDMASFLPIRDYQYYILRRREIFPYPE